MMADEPWGLDERTSIEDGARRARDPEAKWRMNYEAVGVRHTRCTRCGRAVPCAQRSGQTFPHADPRQRGLCRSGDMREAFEALTSAQRGK